MNYLKRYIEKNGEKKKEREEKEEQKKVKETTIMVSYPRLIRVKLSIRFLFVVEQFHQFVYNRRRTLNVLCKLLCNN